MQMHGEGSLILVIAHHSRCSSRLIDEAAETLMMEWQKETDQRKACYQLAWQRSYLLALGLQPGVLPMQARNPCWRDLTWHLPVGSRME